ncbi:glycoside hydrolase, partial [Streptomyces sp. SID4931]
MIEVLLVLTSLSGLVSRVTPRPAAATLLAIAVAAVGLGPAASPAAAATIPAGAGSYTDSRPAGTQGPTTNTGAPVTPKLTSAVRDKPVPTNDWWSS